MNEMVMEVSELARRAFKDRYNRNVTVSQGRELNGDGTSKIAVTEIKYFDDVYTITEYLANNLTDYVLVDDGEKEYRFKTYLEGEVFVADAMGKE